MAFGRSDRNPDAPAAPGSSLLGQTIPLKLVVAGGFAVGKTTFVGSISEIAPLTTEAAMTTAALGVDDAGTADAKTDTTVAMDFGRITISDDLVLYLFGTPGQERFWFLWDELVRGAIGAVVLVDSTRIDDSFPAIDYFEGQGLPFMVAVNCFHGEAAHDLEDIRDALAINGHVPIGYCDARERDSTKQALVTLLQHAIDCATARV